MAEPLLISICIPAFKHFDYLKRLLDSIAIQSFRSFEVVITDDSSDERIQLLAREYASRIRLRYFRNPLALGSPENWNESIRKAVGNWIKPMHDDDWFCDEHSLKHFAEAIESHPACGFIFSAYQKVILNTGETQNIFARASRLNMLRKNPVTLFSKNTIGPPSTAVYRAHPALLYDREMKWLVDIDFYIRYLQGSNPVYIDKTLVKIGFGKEQVTEQSFRKRSIEIPESFLLLQKTGAKNLRNIIVYDAWWRLMRNLGIKNKDEIIGAGYSGGVDPVILSMINWQRKWPASFLQIGILSKLLMGLHYLTWRKQLPRV